MKNRIKGWWARLGQPRPWPVAIGVSLVAVPTVFTMFPGLTEWPRVPRLGVAIVWGTGAAVLVRSSLSNERRIERLVEHAEGEFDEARAVTLDAFLGLAFDPAISRIPGNWQVTVYLADVAQGLLLPFYPEQVTDPADPSVFPFGAGATGRAYETNESTFVFGDAVSDASYGLSGRQREFFAQYTAVGAVPIRDPEGLPLGTVTVITALDDGWLGAVEGDSFQAGQGVELLERVVAPLGDAFASLLGGTLQL